MEFENLLRTLREYATEAVANYKDRLLSDDKKASGQLINSISSEIKVGGEQFTVVLNLVDYWQYVEDGRKPGKFPPPSAILKWITVKPVIPRPMHGKLPTKEQLAFLIGRKIATEGIEPGNQLKETVDSLNARYIPKLQAALEEDFTDYVIKTYNEVGKMIVI